MNIFNTREELFLTFKNDLVIVELGVFKGEFSKFIHKNLNPKKLYLVDLFEGYIGSGDKDGNNMEYTDLSNEHTNLSNFFSGQNNVSIIKSSTTDFLKNMEDESIDLIYIDADHEYLSVVNDLSLSYSKIKHGGLICGHDYVSPRFDGVVRAVNEFCNEKKLEINYITKDGCPTYCIIKK